MCQPIREGRHGQAGSPSSGDEHVRRRQDLLDEQCAAVLVDVSLVLGQLSQDCCEVLRDAQDCC